jgi:hypothetical protein
MAISMKLVVRLVAIFLLVAGGVALTRLSLDNHELEEEIAQLEAELGRMQIDDSDRVYLVEIEAPDVPPEVASHLERVWQFRCYLPKGYDVIRFSGGGRVAKDGLYFNGGFGSGSGSPLPEAIHQMVTVSLQKKDDRLEAFHTFGGSSRTTTWGELHPDHVDESLVVQKTVSSEQGPRSFDQDTILPLLKIYDPGSAEDKKVAGKATTTYAGGLFVLCPKSRQGVFDQLRRGEMPDKFDPGWIAREAADE